MSRYRSGLKTGMPGSVLWLAPTWRAAADVRNRILCDSLDVCFTPGVFTFGKFAQAILESSPAPIRPLTHSMKRQLVRQLIDEQIAQGRMQYFRPISSTGGLVDLVCEFIGEFKRLEIWPDEFRTACQARGLTAKDAELLEIYEVYQQTLRQNQLYDAEGRFWSARDWLQKGQKRPFENLKLVVVDGFTDFTRTQHEILEQLASWVDEIIISLPLESEPCRTDLFTKPLKTLEELQRRHGNLSIHELSRPKNISWPAMRHLETNLFINPRLRDCPNFRSNENGTVPLTASSSIKEIEILAAAKSQGEIELIGATIKRLLAQGIARPGDIAVVFRSPQEHGGLAAEVFDRLGIPSAWETGQRLNRIPALRALTGLLRLDLEDWPFRQLLTVIGSNYFQPEWPEWDLNKTASLVENNVRNLHIPHGRKNLLDQFNTANADDNSTAVVLNRLGASFDALPQKTTLPQWAKAWEKLATETGLLKSIVQAKNSRDCPNFRLNENGTVPFNAPIDNDTDVIAWNRLQNTLTSGDTLARWLNRSSAEIDRNEAFLSLSDILENERMPLTEDECGRVRILSAASIRSLEIPYLFLAGLSEKAFPPPDREDRLYSDSEYLQLIDKGLPLVARTERTREEMLLFYEALTRATRRLYLSYPALDAAAQPLSPSPYLLEVEQVFGKGNIPRTEATDLRPIPTGDDPLSFAQFRVKAMADALGGNVSFLTGLLQFPRDGADYRLRENGDIPFSASNILPALEMIILRQDRESFGPADGMLLGKSVKKLLAGEFSEHRCFTASELEQYATCPYRFLLENILKLQPLEDITLQLDVMERGQIVHDVLASFHRLVNESLGHIGSPLQLEPELFDRLLQKAIDDSLPRPSANPVRRALAEINRRLIAKWLAGYREQHQDYDKLWESFESPIVPELFEVSFGKSKHRQDVLSDDDPQNDPLEFITGEEVVRISGRIDRIDTGKIANHIVFNILDYKTSASVNFSIEDVARGTCLQLPVYALATTELLLNDRDAIPWQAGYWHIREHGYRPKKSLIMYQLIDGKIFTTPEWEQIRATLDIILPALVNGIRRGCFPVFNSDRYCIKYCPLNTFCRIRQIRSMEKTWLPMP